jgi:hypothetical protein
MASTSRFSYFTISAAEMAKGNFSTTQRIATPHGPGDGVTEEARSGYRAIATGALGRRRIIPLFIRSRRRGNSRRWRYFADAHHYRFPDGS